MQYLAIASLLVSLVSGVAVDLAKRDSPLSVSIELVGNSEVKASITNSGEAALKLLKTGSILDAQPVEKTEVMAAGSKVGFEGIRLTIATTGLPEDAFQVIAAGETLETSFDVAAVHDMSSGGDFDITSVGAFSYAEADSSDITGAVAFSSNTVSAKVDGAAAAKVRREFHDMVQKRAAVQSDCTGTRRTATTNALSSCRSLAAQASQVAASGAAAKMTEYFKSSSSATRSTVAQVFARVASECGSTTSGARYYCTDVLSACSSGVLAYTQPSSSLMVNCNLYYTGLTALSRTCHAQDQATTTLHEMTHLTSVKGTDDYGVYGYAAVQRLSAAQNLNHADTYTLFAQSIYAGC